ncbi:hypothetical protein K501DRAFT_272514 [Backusella circina FSU 941]|nr:hypothetical protein K501DRAFT_272514 [Backusella circina FSU 941]
MNLLSKDMCITIKCIYSKNNMVVYAFHVIVDCPVKWTFCSRFLDELNPLSHFPTSLHIWTAFVSFTQYRTENTLGIKLATLFGSVLTTLRRYHYHYHSQQGEWPSIAALRLLHSHTAETENVRPFNLQTR